MARDVDDHGEEVPPGWTVRTVFSYFQSILKEMNLRIEQRFDGQEKAVAAALASVKEATSTQKEAILKAEESMAERFRGVNEFRALANDILAKAMPRNESDNRFAGITEILAQKEKAETAWREAITLRLVALDKKVDMHTAERVGSRDTVGSFRSNVSTAIALIAVVISLTMAFYSMNRPAVANVVAPVSTAPK